MLNLFNYIRFRRQAPTNKPPKGYYDLRVSKATGALVLVDEDGTETATGEVTSVAGRTGDVTIASADISDATATLAEGKILKGDVLGLATIPQLNTGTLTIGGGSDTVATSVSQVSGAQTATFPPTGGTVALVAPYADETAANTAEAANVVYYNQATAKFQITTA